MPAERCERHVQNAAVTERRKTTERATPTRRAKMLKGADKGPRARSRRSRQRQRLIDACISALHIYGPSRTTVARVVAIAKMSPGIVRFYFDSKAAMLVASLQFLSAEFEDQVLVPVTKLKSRPVAALQSMIDLYFDPDIASPRKVSVWYAFWGEASSRQEYYDICGQKDEGFAALVRELIESLIVQTSHRHLDADGIALGFIGALEILWQDIAFQTERDIDRPAAKRRCMAYLRSIFPGHFSAAADQSAHVREAAETLHFPKWVYGDSRILAIERETLFQAAWMAVGHESQLPKKGDFITADLGIERVLVVRDDSGVLRAMRNSCPEVSHTLVTERQGRFDSEIECPVHGLRFSWEGRAHGCEATANLRALDVDCAGGLLWVKPVRPTPTDERARLDVPLALQPSQGLSLLLPPTQTSIAADWKIVVELWLECTSLAVLPTVSVSSIAWEAPLLRPDLWSANRYVRLMGCLPEQTWQRQFIAPHQLLEARPDGLSILQVLPTEPGRSLVRRLDYTALPPDDSARAALYLAGRLGRLTRRSMQGMAESVQRGMIDYGYEMPRRAVVPPAVAWFRAQLAARLPVLMRERPPNDSRTS